MHFIQTQHKSQLEDFISDYDLYGNKILSKVEVFEISDGGAL